MNNGSDTGGITGLTPSTQAAMIAQNPQIQPYSGNLGWVDPCPRMLTLNTMIAPWDRKEMRHALSYAMNRRQIVDVVYEGAGGDSAVSNFIFPPTRRCSRIATPRRTSSPRSPSTTRTGRIS